MLWSGNFCVNKAHIDYGLSDAVESSRVRQNYDSQCAWAWTSSGPHSSRLTANSVTLESIASIGRVCFNSRAPAGATMACGSGESKHCLDTTAILLRYSVMPG